MKKLVYVLIILSGFSVHATDEADVTLRTHIPTGHVQQLILDQWVVPDYFEDAWIIDPGVDFDRRPGRLLRRGVENHFRSGDFIYHKYRSFL